MSKKVKICKKYWEKGKSKFLSLRPDLITIVKHDLGKEIVITMIVKLIKIKK